jgi:type IV secretory pathway VirJ component
VKSRIFPYFATTLAAILAASAMAAADPSVSAHTQPDVVDPATKPGTHVARHRAPLQDPKAARVVNVDGVGKVTVYAAQGEPRGLALFASGDGGWELGVWDMAQTAASLGYVVAGFSTPALLKSLDAGTGACSDSAAALEKIGNEVKTAMKLPRRLAGHC